MEQRIRGFIQHIEGVGWQVWLRLLPCEQGDDEVEYGVLMGTPTRIVQQAVSMMHDALQAVRTQPSSADTERLMRGERLQMLIEADKQALR